MSFSLTRWVGYVARYIYSSLVLLQVAREEYAGQVCDERGTRELPPVGLISLFWKGWGEGEEEQADKLSKTQLPRCEDTGRLANQGCEKAPTVCEA